MKKLIVIPIILLNIFVSNSSIYELLKGYWVQDSVPSYFIEFKRYLFIDRRIHEHDVVYNDNGFYAAEFKYLVKGSGNKISIKYPDDIWLNFTRTTFAEISKKLDDIREKKEDGEAFHQKELDQKTKYEEFTEKLPALIKDNVYHTLKLPKTVDDDYIRAFTRFFSEEIKNHVHCVSLKTVEVSGNHLKFGTRKLPDEKGKEIIVPVTPELLKSLKIELGKSEVVVTYKDEKYKIYNELK
ncbi:MAG: hypothetical protein LBF08_03970 [Dysgonamonadaceae bacterium]|jgi:hypothetical protein|nr:hypothetical protein [Dysgonamonadaceae bacterium]